MKICENESSRRSINSLPFYITCTKNTQTHIQRVARGSIKGQTSTHTHAYFIKSHKQTNTHMYMHTYICTYIKTHTYICIHKHIHTYQSEGPEM
mgnify:CR=1 FL=1